MLRRLPGGGWLVLIGGGEFSFGETLAADRVWVEKTPSGPLGFLPTASGSTDYCELFARYMRATFSREVQLIPIYRSRDARRRKNLERIQECAAVYLGGGVTDELLGALSGSPALEALGRKLSTGGVIVAIAAAAQAMGRAARSLFGGGELPGFGWLPDGVVEPNFDPGHDRRLRQSMQRARGSWGLGLPARSAVLLGPDGRTKCVGTAFVLQEADGDFQVLRELDSDRGERVE